MVTALSRRVQGHGAEKYEAGAWSWDHAPASTGARAGACGSLSP